MTVPELTHGTTTANLGIAKVDFPLPLFCGDTVPQQRGLRRHSPHASPTFLFARDALRHFGHGFVRRSESLVLDN